MPSGYPVAVHALGATDMNEAHSQGLNSHDALKEAEEMRNLLIAFALKRGRSILTPEWDRVALLVAAFEHPELQLSHRQSTRRKRGRPALPRGLSTIVSGPQPIRPSEEKQNEFDRLALQIDAARNLALQQRRKVPTIASLVREHVSLTTPPTSSHFKPRVRALESSISKARKRLRRQREFDQMLRENPRNF